MSQGAMRYEVLEHNSYGKRNGAILVMKQTRSIRVAIEEKNRLTRAFQKHNPGSYGVRYYIRDIQTGREVETPEV